LQPKKQPLKKQLGDRAVRSWREAGWHPARFTA
jgi:hypothetical protein